MLEAILLSFLPFSGMFEVFLGNKAFETSFYPKIGRGAIVVTLTLLPLTIS
jgi:hypothetical protein